MDKYTMGPVPSNDFPLAFSNADEQIFVSKTPLFSAEECAKVIDWAEARRQGHEARHKWKVSDWSRVGQGDAVRPQRV